MLANLSERIYDKNSRFTAAVRFWLQDSLITSAADIEWHFDPTYEMLMLQVALQITDRGWQLDSEDETLP